MVTTTDDFAGAEPPVVEAAPETPDTTPTRVLMRAHISGTRNGEPWPLPGEELTVPAYEAQSLYHNHLAEPATVPVREPEAEEAAVIDETPPERAVVSRARSARPARGGRSKGEQR